MNKINNHIFIDDNLVQNIQFYEPFKSDLTCCICHGLLNDPLLCSGCEVAFCINCINEWKLNNKNCPLKCSYFELKPINKMHKSIMEKINLKCDQCKLDIKLIDYPNHYNDCKDKHIEVSCPFCPECKINYYILRTTKLDVVNFSSYEEKISSLTKDLEKSSKKLEKTSEDLGKKSKELEKTSKELVKALNDLDYLKKPKKYENCRHFPNTKFVPIFPCCGNDYNCYNCHDKNEKHEHKQTKDGYCMKCHTMFYYNKQINIHGMHIMLCLNCKADFNDIL